MTHRSTRPFSTIVASRTYMIGHILWLYFQYWSFDTWKVYARYTTDQVRSFCVVDWSYSLVVFSVLEFRYLESIRTLHY